MKEANDGEFVFEESNPYDLWRVFQFMYEGSYDSSDISFNTLLDSSEESSTPLEGK